MVATTPVNAAEARRHSSHSHTQRHDGGTAAFDAEWTEALRTGDRRWQIYPDRDGGEQAALNEWVKAQQVLRLLRHHRVPSGTVLEYGCGAAGMSVFLKNQGYTTFAIDRSPGALEVAARNDRSHAQTPAPLHRTVADVQALPAPSATFDVVMSYGLLEHFDGHALGGALAEAVRVLRPGGVFVADIIPARPNARAVGIAFSFAASLIFHTVRGRLGAVRSLSRLYYDHEHQTSLGPDTWERLLVQQGLAEVQVAVCRPFPPLAITGPLEHAYAAVMRRALPLWRRFDGAQTRCSRAWGWMYLVSGVKPATRAGGAP